MDKESVNLCCCWDGYVYIGHMVEVDGEEVEEISIYHCRCTEEAA